MKLTGHRISASSGLNFGFAFDERALATMHVQFPRLTPLLDFIRVYTTAVEVQGWSFQRIQAADMP